MSASETKPTGRELQDTNNEDTIFVSSYPIEALGPLANLAKSTAEIVQAPIEVVAQCLLSILSLVTQGIASVQTPFMQECPLSLCLVTAIESWPKKKFIDRILFSDIKGYEQDQQRMLVDHLRRKSGDDRTSGARDADKISLGCLHMLSGLSFEQVVKNLSDLSGSILYSSEDLTQFLGRSGRKANNIKFDLDNYFDKIWSGETFTLTHGSALKIIRGRRVALSLYVDNELAPDVLRFDKISSRSFLSKSLVSCPNWNVEYDTFVDATDLKPIGIEDFSDRCISLLTQIESPPAEKYNELSPRVLKLGGKERMQLLEFVEDVEAHSKPGEYFAAIRSFTQNTAEHICRLAGVLEIYSDPNAVNIGNETLNNSIELYRYYLNEMKNAQAPNSVDEAISDAERLLIWLKNQYQKHLEETGSSAFQVRYVLQRTHSSMRSKDKLARALKELEDRRCVTVDMTTKEITLRDLVED
ncbi:DUF3987 domain-containing protein [Methylobacterium sp. J-092]|uniref:DUF3987 domain-containing protein n=1 Tax=Methylobacterium sp. J-092 TaxID=2836667 RepID=UPI001FB92D41|nr:DUF3987 domain-containing protein [Methylobacterium sp. J-092]MCJ2006749.1 DUF3987 domain-containing protein [Methylobacterium sp. J-092]